MNAVPQRCQDAFCPMATIAKGFACHSGKFPPRVGICIMLEAAGTEEPSFILKDLPNAGIELAYRRELYPTLEDQFVRLGLPVVGRAGSLMWNWLMRPMNLQRSDVVVVNALACCPGKGKDGNFFYPTGNVRKRAEATCADLWMQHLLEWNPTVSVVGMHPSALSRDITPLPVVLRAIEKAKTFAAKGERVLLLMGGKSAKHWLGYAENSTRWCGHWQRETDWTRARRLERWAANRRLSVTKAVKLKKLTAKTALARLLSLLTPCKSFSNPDEILGWGAMDTQLVGPIEYAEMAALLVSKSKTKAGVTV